MPRSLSLAIALDCYDYFPLGLSHRSNVLRGTGVQNSFFAYAKNLGKCGELTFGRSPRILLRKIKEADESPGGSIQLNNKYNGG